MPDPELVVGNGSMGLWKALAEVFPAARHQRCWVHKARNVTNALPRSAHTPRRPSRRSRAPTAPSSPRPSPRSPTTENELLAFYDFPAEHWIHPRTTNPIESTFSTGKLRTKVTRGAGSPAAALAMMFKLVESAQTRWRAITGTHLVALVRAAAAFENGALVERAEAAA